VLRQSDRSEGGYAAGRLRGCNGRLRLELRR
jgi:hypothetical protein